MHRGWRDTLESGLHRGLVAALLALALPGCLTPVGTEITAEGDARALRYALTGEYDAAVPDMGAVRVHYQTSADKALSLSVGADGTLSFESVSDSAGAVAARLEDSRRVEGQQDALAALIAAYLRAAPPPGPAP